MTKTKKDEIPFEKAFKRLEEIVESLENGESSLDEAMKAFEEGMSLVKVCNEKLNTAEAQLKRLIKGDDGEFRLELME